MAVAVLASCGSESEAPASETRVVKQLLVHRDTGISAPDPEVVFYFHKKTGEAESENTEGKLDLDSWHHAARPYDKRAQLSGVAWEEGEWFRSDESGTEQYYHVGKRPAVFAPSPVRTEVRVADNVRALVDQSEPEQRLEVT